MSDLKKDSVVNAVQPVASAPVVKEGKTDLLLYVDACHPNKNAKSKNWGVATLYKEIRLKRAILTGAGLPATEEVKTMVDGKEVITEEPMFEEQVKRIYFKQSLRNEADAIRAKSRIGKDLVVQFLKGTYQLRPISNEWDAPVLDSEGNEMADENGVVVTETRVSKSIWIDVVD